MKAACGWAQPQCDYLSLPAPQTPGLVPTGSSGEKHHDDADQHALRLLLTAAAVCQADLIQKNRSWIDWLSAEQRTNKASVRITCSQIITPNATLYSAKTLSAYYTNRWAVEEADGVARQQGGLYPSQVVEGIGHRMRA